MKKKIIILYSTGGMGHKKAALALLDAFKARKDGVDAEAIDVLEYGNRFYNFIYRDLYLFLMGKGKAIWGALYDFTNLPAVDHFMRKIREASDLANLRGLKEMLIKKDPDAIIATHFILPNIAGALRKCADLDARLYTVMTDYGPHSFWLSDYMDRFFVGSESAMRETVKRKIPKTKISVTGIPAVKEFNIEYDIEKLRKKYKLDKNKRTVFLLSGGFGVGPMEKILVSLNACSADIQVIAVCGHNKVAYESIKAMKKDLKYPVVLFGFSDKVAELMAVSDLMVTKAGGISTTEALNMRLPMILFASVPGQETWNEKMLISGGAAEKARRVDEIPTIANRILISDDVYESLKEGIDKLRSPDAAKTITDIVMEDI